MSGLQLSALSWPCSVEDALAPALSAALSGRGPAVCVVPSAAPERVLAAARPDQPLERDDVAAVVATSGSTGAAKGVLLTAAALTASARLTHGRLGGPGQWLLALPPYGIAGLQVVVRSLLAGSQPVLLDLLYGFEVAEFVAATRRLTGRRRYTAVVPTQLTRLLAAGETALDALRTYDAVLVGGAAAAAGSLAEARDAGVRVVTTYGMTETCGGCVYDGVPLDGVAVALHDDVISLAGPTIAAGYRLDPELTAAAFAGGWFRTADRGLLDEDGRLVVAGRADDAIVTGGLTVDPVEVETVLVDHPAVAAAAVYGVPDDTWGQRVVAAVVLADATVPPALAELREHAGDRLGRERAPREIRLVDALPYLPNGKLDRSRLRRLLR